VGTRKEIVMAFDTLEMSLVVLEQLASVEARVRLKRKSLADEIGRAAESVALNVSEARARAGLDRADLYRRAAGSASELTTALRIARARGYITDAEYGAVDAALDRVRAMLWRLTH
jgi:four helix bundle protein